MCIRGGEREAQVVDGKADGEARQIASARVSGKAPSSLGEIDGELLLYAGVLRLFPLGTQDLGWARRTDTVPLTVLDDVITPIQGIEGIGCRCMPRYM